jgi:hypothetical protein
VVTTKNAVFYDIKFQFVSHKRHITLPLESRAGYGYVRFEVLIAASVKNAVFWHVTPCGSSKNRRFGGTYRLHHQSDKNRRARNNVSNNKQQKLRHSS